MTKSKIKVSFTIDERIIERARRKANNQNIPLSRIVENFLKYYSDPWLYCFKCSNKFQISESEICPKCGWLKCPKCKACGCELNQETRTVAFFMRLVYEDMLMSRLK